MSEARSVPPLRIAVLGDFEGLHTRRWLEVFVEHGHEMHAISFYRPAAELPGVTLHVLSEGGSERKAGGERDTAGTVTKGGWKSALRRLMPPSAQRFIDAQRYTRAGLKAVLAGIRPDVFHAHFVVEHGFYGSYADFHPYVVSAWGSDLLVASHTAGGRLIARRALAKADLVTANDVSLARRAAELGVPEDRIEVVHLGIDRVFLDAGLRSVNLGRGEEAPPTVISDRALERLYNIDVVLQAFARLRQSLPDARLVIAGDGSERERLEGLARDLGLGDSVRFAGRLSPEELAGTLAGAHVYVSVPSSDSLALSTVEAMAAGCFPVVAELPSNEGWIEDGINALVVPPRDETALAEALQRALTDDGLRRAAVGPNRARVEAEGLRERNMLLMERHYYRLAGHPLAGGGEGI